MEAQGSPAQGKVFWITGLSGAGKTTVGKALYQELKKQNPATVFLDGDSLREVFGNDLGYSREDRMACAMRYGRLCKLLSDQGLVVICCTISMFHSIHKWNREHIRRYREIYLRVDPGILQQRNQKQLYTDFDRGKTGNVVGLDLRAELPKSPDLVLDSDGTQSINEMIHSIVNME